MAFPNHVPGLGLAPDSVQHAAAPFLHHVISCHAAKVCNTAVIQAALHDSSLFLRIKLGWTRVSLPSLPKQAAMVVLGM